MDKIISQIKFLILTPFIILALAAYIYKLRKELGENQKLMDVFKEHTDQEIMQSVIFEQIQENILIAYFLGIFVWMMIFKIIYLIFI